MMGGLSNRDAKLIAGNAYASEKFSRSDEQTPSGGIFGAHVFELVCRRDNEPVEDSTDQSRTSSGVRPCHARWMVEGENCECSRNGKRLIECLKTDSGMNCCEWLNQIFNADRDRRIAGN